MKQVSYRDFEKLEILTGRILSAEDFPEAKKTAYKLWIDFGSCGIKKSSAQIAELYNKDELTGKTILAVTNFPPKQVANFVSEVLVLGVVIGDNKVVLVQPDRDVPLGRRVL